MSPIASCGCALGIAAVQLAVADDAFALGADVDQDLVLVDPDDGALDHVAVLEALDVRVLLGEELLHRRRLGTKLASRRRAPLPRPRPGHRPARRRAPLRRRRCRGRRSRSGSATGSGAARPTGGLGGRRRARPARGLDRARPLRPVRPLRLGSAAATGARRLRLASSAATAGAASSVGWRLGARRSAVAGSSATATAATVSSAPGGPSRRCASTSGAGPPCCCSVNLVVSPCRWITPPGIRNGPSDARAV